MSSTPGESPELHPLSPGRRSLFGASAALFWVALCVRWFDPAAPWRPAALDAIPPGLLALVTAGLALAWLRESLADLRGDARAPVGEVVLLLLLAFFFRLPIVARGAASAVTPDGALSGIVALHALQGSEHLVFVPHVPYSGSLKSHITAPLCAVMDPARAFALVSVLFYLLYVAGLHRLALYVFGPRAALVAGLYAVFSPPFLTRYSVSNDGNYVEVLALGTWALWLGARFTVEKERRATLALAAGLLLGLAFWCHILAVIHLVALAVVLVLAARASSAPSLAALAVGSGLGYVPGLIWNAAHDWLSFQYLMPGEARGASAGVALLTGIADKLHAMITDHWPVLMGYDTGYGPVIDGLLLVVAWAAVAAASYAWARTVRRARAERSWPLLTLLVFSVFDVGIALAALPHVPGNPRYLLFLMSVLPVFLADAFDAGRRRLGLLALIAVAAVASLAQLPPTLKGDARWRGFVAALEAGGVRWCYTDFFMATRINFVSAERVVCTAKLGPVTTEYFFAYREEVEAAPEAAFVAVNRTAARRLERRLDEIGVAHTTHEWMKPVVVPARKVDPEELFPWRDFPWR